MCSPDTPQYSTEERETLLRLARESIEYAVESGRRMRLSAEDYPERLREVRACFVTLNRHHALRGCIGHLEAVQPLVLDVAENAHAAAFKDPRFPALRAAELERLEIHISVLSPPQPLSFASEQEAIAQIRPGVDGLVLQDGARRGTFLPAVWDSLPAREEFWRHLKRKAGLTEDYWSNTIEVFRYQTEAFPS